MSKQATSRCHLQIQDFPHLWTALEEPFKDLFGIVGKPIASFELSLVVQSLFQCLVAVLVIESTFDWVAED